MKSTRRSLIPNTRKPAPANKASSAAARPRIAAISMLGRPASGGAMTICEGSVGSCQPPLKANQYKPSAGRHDITRIKQQDGNYILEKADRSTRVPYSVDGLGIT